MPEDILVEHIDHEEWGMGEIKEVDYDTGDPLVVVEWQNGRHSSHWVEELEFLLIPR